MRELLTQSRSSTRSIASRSCRSYFLQTTLRQKGPGYWNTGAQNAFENKTSQLPCRSRLISDLAPFFIELRAERSSASGCGFCFLIRVQRWPKPPFWVLRPRNPWSPECRSTPAAGTTGASAAVKRRTRLLSGPLISCTRARSDRSRTSTRRET